MPRESSEADLSGQKNDGANMRTPFESISEKGNSADSGLNSGISTTIGNTPSEVTTFYRESTDDGFGEGQPVGNEIPQHMALNPDNAVRGDVMGVNDGLSRPYGPKPTWYSCTNGQCMTFYQNDNGLEGNNNVRTSQQRPIPFNDARYGAAKSSIPLHAPMGATGPGAIIFLLSGAGVGVAFVRRSLRG